MEAVGVHCHCLEKLTLDSESVNDVGLLAIAQGCPSLKYLHLQCVNIIDETLKAVGRFCISLKTLILCSFQKYTNRCHNSHN